MAAMRAFKSMLDYHTHLLLLIILKNGIISSVITHKYSIYSGIIFMLTIQPEVSKRKQFDQDGKKIWISHLLGGGGKVTVPIFGCGTSELKIVSVPAA